MTARAFFVVVWVSLVAAAAVAGEERRTAIEIAVDGSDGNELTGGEQAHDVREVRIIKEKKDATN